MIDEGIFSGLTFPSPMESVFRKIVSFGWYDGTTSGIALHSLRLLAFSFDLVDWGPYQEVRVFALSPATVLGFEESVKLLSQSEEPKWPMWYPPWPKEMQEHKRMGLELDMILAGASSPEYVFATESRFETILAARHLTKAARALLPAEFDDQPNGDFGYWQKYLELPT